MIKKMKIPECLTLNKNQEKILKEFVDKHPPLKHQEDCTGASRFTFEIFSTGIGDCIYVICGKDKVYLNDGLEP